MDQASFLALRALGRGPVIQYVWIYEHGVDLNGLRRFHRNLHHTLLGRLIERSPLPFGRHRWVSYAPETASLDIAVAERSRAEVWDWVDERSFVPVDPEFGPPWHLGVQPLTGGGAAVCLAISHTTADAVAGIRSIVSSVQGVRGDFGFPSAAARGRWRALREDIGVTVRSVREIPAAVTAGARLAREQQEELSASVKAALPAQEASRGGPVVVPRVYGAIDARVWDDRATSLGATRNVLVAALATRIGDRLGRTDQHGRVLLSIPVSERTEGDTRANPLNAITVHADPSQVCEDLTDLRAAMKAALVELGESRETILAPLAMLPFTPRAVARRLENLVLKVGKPVGCSNVGEVPDAANRPDGTDADFFGIRGGEAGVTAATLERLGGHLLVSVVSLRGKIWFSVASWESHALNTKDALLTLVRAALDDLDLTAVLE
ncbi:hypothetical protein QN239_29655 [Mycolicibacterium sp. Y3]